MNKIPFADWVIAEIEKSSQDLVKYFPWMGPPAYRLTDRREFFFYRNGQLYRGSFGNATKIKLTFRQKRHLKRFARDCDKKMKEAYLEEVRQQKENDRKAQWKILDEKIDS